MPRSDGGGWSRSSPRLSSVYAVELVEPTGPVEGLEAGHAQLDVAVGHLAAVPAGRGVCVLVDQRQGVVEIPLGPTAR